MNVVVLYFSPYDKLLGLFRLQIYAFLHYAILGEMENMG